MNFGFRSALTIIAVLAIYSFSVGRCPFADPLASSANGHRPTANPLSGAEGHPHYFQEKPRLLVIFRRCDDGDVHAFRLVHFGHVDLREDEVIADDDVVVAASVERALGQTAEVAD